MLALFFCAFLGSLVASGHMHERMLECMMHAPLKFYDITPLGRIINRFSTDVDNMDLNLGGYLAFWATYCSSVVTILAIISYTIPIFLAVALPVGIFYYFIHVMENIKTIYTLGEIMTESHY